MTLNLCERLKRRYFHVCALPVTFNPEKAGNLLHYLGQMGPRQTIECVGGELCFHTKSQVFAQSHLHVKIKYTQKCFFLKRKSKIGFFFDQKGKVFERPEKLKQNKQKKKKKEHFRVKKNWEGGSFFVVYLFIFFQKWKLLKIVQAAHAQTDQHRTVTNCERTVIPERRIKFCAGSLLFHSLKSLNCYIFRRKPRKKL